MWVGDHQIDPHTGLVGEWWLVSVEGKWLDEPVLMRLVRANNETKQYDFALNLLFSNFTTSA